MQIGNYRIRKVDSLNMTFEELQENGNWERVGGYFSDLKILCKSLKDYIIIQNIDKVKDADGMFELLNDISKVYERLEYVDRV